MPTVQVFCLKCNIKVLCWSSSSSNISIVHKIKISMPHPFIQFCINMSLSVFENDHFTPHGGDIVQVNNQLRAERTSKLTFTNVKPLLNLIVTILEKCIMKIKTLTPKLTMIVCDIMEWILLQTSLMLWPAWSLRFKNKQKESRILKLRYTGLNQNFFVRRKVA